MPDSRPVFFFDIDNCLYSSRTKIYDSMVELIDKYLMNHFSLSSAAAAKLHSEYLKDYGLAIEGLVRNHKVDPLGFNAKVDDAVPLEEILSPDPELRRLLDDMDKSKVKPWMFTNAYVTNARRVVRLLGIDDLFEGITYYDYSTFPLRCKPHNDSFAKAMKEAGVEDAAKCYLVGSRKLFPIVGECID